MKRWGTILNNEILQVQEKGDWVLFDDAVKAVQEAYQNGLAVGYGRGKGVWYDPSQTAPFEEGD